MYFQTLCISPSLHKNKIFVFTRKKKALSWSLCTEIFFAHFVPLCIFGKLQVFIMLDLIMLTSNLKKR